MTVCELMDKLFAIAKKHGGDIDVTYVYDLQFCDIDDVEVIGRKNCPAKLRWCQSGTVAVIKLGN